MINTFGAYFLRNQLREKNTIVGQTNLLWIRIDVFLVIHSPLTYAKRSKIPLYVFYIGIGDTNYIIFRNLEIFIFFPIKIIVKEFFFQEYFICQNEIFVPP